MKKSEFVTTIGAEFKREGFRKKGTYWYREKSDYLECVWVHGSQWEKDDYYVEIGFADKLLGQQNPSYLQWIAAHRCKGTSGELNICPQEVLKEFTIYFLNFSSKAEVIHFVNKHSLASIAGQHRF